LNFSHNSLSQHYTPCVVVEDLDFEVDSSSLLSERGIVLDTDRTGISFLGCREGQKTPSEVFQNIGINNLFSILKAEFDIILVEGAALNYFVDSRELAEYADAVFTVFTAASSLSSNDEKSIHFVMNLGNKNGGAILNNVHIENMQF
jgi:Mrp family chromosome partitioning ATPase